MKLTLTIILAFVASVGVAQKLQVATDSLLKARPDLFKNTNTIQANRGESLIFGKSTVSVNPKYKDTVNCLIRAIDTLNGGDRWYKAKVVLNNGRIEVPIIGTSYKNSYAPNYAHIAIGPFSNKFISSVDLKGKLIMQVSILDNPTKP